MTLVLIVALTNLIIRGCRLEKEQAQQLVETVEEAKPSATRVFGSRDLKIVLSRIALEAKKDERGKQSRTASHEIEIYNSGNVPYREIRLRIDYLDRNGNTVETRPHSLVQTISPGSSLKLANVSMDNVPSTAADAKITIISADIASPTASNK